MIAVLLSLAVGQYSLEPVIGFARGVAAAPPLPVGIHSKFKVSILNGTKVAVSFPSEKCSWGYEMISFELVSPAGKSQIISRKPKSWYKNALVGDSTSSTEMVIRSIDFSDGTWVGLPAGVSGQTDGWKIKVRAVVEKGKYLSDRGYWTGKMESKFTDAIVKD